MSLPCPIATEHWGSAINSLVNWEEPPEVGPTRRSIDRPKSLSAESLLLPHSIAEPSAAESCLSGIWLWLDELDRSHDISQTVSSREGSYWHGIMHRRETDYSNAKYWFRKVGKHPVFAGLAQWVDQHIHAPELRDQLDLSHWSPDAFIDACQLHAHASPEVSDQIRSIAAAEWFLLFDHCFQQAIS